MGLDLARIVLVGPGQVAQQRDAGEGGTQIIVQVLRDARPLVLEGAFLFQQLEAALVFPLFHDADGARQPKPATPATASPMNHRACQKCGSTIKDKLAPASFQVPPLLQAMTRNRYWPGGT